MRYRRWVIVASLGVLVVASPLAAGAADKPADLDREAREVDAATSSQSQAQVADRIADQLNAQWAPNSPAFTADSVGQQRGANKFGGWGGVLIGDLIAINVAKSMLAAPGNTLTPAQALTAATQEVMDARRGENKKGWGQIAQNLTGQKLGSLMTSVQPAAAAVTGQPTGPGKSMSSSKSAKEAGQASSKAARTDQAFGNSFDTPASASVAVAGPGIGRGHDDDPPGKDAGNRDVTGKDAGRGGEGPGGGNGGGGHGGKGK
jgi:hypothetical protein